MALFNRSEKERSYHEYYSVAIAVREGILLSKNQSLSTDYLAKDWGKYLFRIGMVKRKSNAKAEVDVEKFDEVKKCLH